MIKYNDIYDKEVDHICEGTLHDSVMDYIAYYRSLPRTSGFKEWLGNRTYPLNWMIEAFGKDFEKTPEEYYKTAIMKKCAICRREIKLDDIIIQLEFSFCNEYACGFTAHKKCFKNIEKHFR